MADDLGALPLAVGLSRSARRVIRRNLWISLGMVGLLVPATLAGIGEGVALHEGSTLRRDRQCPSPACLPRARTRVREAA
jgi:Cd2+/Zn2+-exporting ATPase